MTCTAQVMETARSALTRLQNNVFEDWIAVGEALMLLRTDAMAQAETNKPKGKTYNAAFGALLQEEGLDGIDQGARWRVFKVMENLPAIQEWRSGLKPERLAMLNHPQAVLTTWEAWKRKQEGGDTDETPKRIHSEFMTIWKGCIPAEKTAILDEIGAEDIRKFMSASLRTELLGDTVKAQRIADKNAAEQKANEAENKRIKLRAPEKGRYDGAPAPRVKKKTTVTMIVPKAHRKFSKFPLDKLHTIEAEFKQRFLAKEQIPPGELAFLDAVRKRIAEKTEAVAVARQGTQGDPVAEAVVMAAKHAANEASTPLH
jgi:hypothetical protein